MQDHFVGIERRADIRLELSLPITLFVDNKIKTVSKNISARGVYFEVETDVMKPPSPGETIMIEIVANVNITGLPDKMVMLSGSGVVVRTNEIEIAEDDKKEKKLCVALRFVENLEIVPTWILNYDFYSVGMHTV
ncbi:MAG: PilZ domain-containing protein [Candidatus Scalinduaceae bacterium]